MSIFFKILKSQSVARLVCFSFGLAITGFSILLYYVEGGKLSYTDSFYISASAICVTGLSPVNLTDISFAGHLIILLMVQLGGLGIITVTVLLGVLIVKGLSRNSELGELVSFAIDSLDNDPKSKDTKPGENDNSPVEVIRIIISIVKISLFIEVCGTIALYYSLPKTIPAEVNRFFLALFTSISAFNNAGFSIINDLSIILNDKTSIAIVSLLIISGGIGFPVIIFGEKVFLDVSKKIMGKFEIWCETHLMVVSLKGKDPSVIYWFLTKISAKIEYQLAIYNRELRGSSNKIQTRIILIGTFILLFTGTLVIFLIESSNPNTLQPLDWPEKLANSFFLSVCARTAGFNTIDIGKIYDASVVLIASLMFIGGGPQGTAGGIKITTFFILILYLKNVIGPTRPVCFNNDVISKKAVQISIRLYFLATTAITAIIFILTLLHKEQGKVKQIFFEVLSAFGTVGYSMGITSSLSDVEKYIYSLVMYVGRIGLFTVLIALTGHSGTANVFDEDDGVKIQVG